MKKINLALTALALAAGAASVAKATPSTMSGVLANGLEWTASHMLTGTTNTVSGGPSPMAAIRSTGRRIPATAAWFSC